jgi:hypothetical protein
MSSDQQQAQPAAQPQQALANGMPHPFVTGSLQGMTATDPSLALGQASAAAAAPLQDKTAPTLAATAPKPALAARVLPAWAAPAAAFLQDKTAPTLAATAPKPALAARVLPAWAAPAAAFLQDKTAPTLAATAPKPALAAPVLPAAASVTASINPPSEKKIPPEAAAAIAIDLPITVNDPTVIPNDCDNEATPIQPAAKEADAATETAATAATAMEVLTPIPSPKQRKRRKYGTGQCSIQI